MFVLARDEMEELVTNCDRFASMKYSSVPMRAFSEHGVIMVASVLKSEIAAQISVRITRVFVAMRRALSSIAPILMRLDTVERRQITDQTRNDENQQRNEERFDTIFKAMDGGDFPPQKVFFDAKHYDAYSFARKLVRKAKKNIVLVDNYCDDVTLDILSQKCGGADVLIASTLYRGGFVETWGRGIDKVCRECASLGVPRPKYDVTESNVMVSIFARGTKSGTKLGTKSAPSQRLGFGALTAYERILLFCSYPMSAREIMKSEGRTDLTKFRNATLVPMIKDGVLELTVPDKPRSRLQKYRLTARGRSVLETVSKQKAEEGL